MFTCMFAELIILFILIIYLTFIYEDKFKISIKI